MTTVAVVLSSTLQSTLGQDGVWAYAVHFTPNPVAHQPDIAHWKDIVLDGAIQDGGSVSIPMPSEYISGKIYFLIQSLDASGPPSTLKTDITAQGQAYINWDNASANDFRYDSFELNLSGKATDVGNLTSVNGFGIGMSVTVGTDTRGYSKSANDIFADIIDASPAGSQNFDFTAGPLAGPPALQRMALSGAEGVAEGAAFAASDWDAYISSLQSQASDIQISGWFNGAPDSAHIWHNAGFYSYTLDWDGTNFWLDPAANSEIKGHIQISPADMANSIYSTLGTVDVFTNKTDATPYLNDMNTGANNQWGGILTQFLTGFTGGYYGGTGNSLNPLVTGTIDLNKNWNWDPTYAFGENGTPSVLPVPPPGDVNAHYDKYAKIFFDNSNSYGAGYSDNLMKAYSAGGPLMSLWDSVTGADASTITIELWDDTEVPGGHIQPQMYNYLPPAAGGYVTPVQFEPGDGLNIGLSLANASVQLKEGTPVSLGLYNATTQSFDVMSVPTPAAGGSIFMNYNVTGNPGNYSLVATNANVTGNMLFNGLPVASDPGTAGEAISWYQITVGAGTHAKTFNLYITTHSDGLGLPTSVQFVNPSYIDPITHLATQQTAIQIDGLGTVAGPNTTQQYVGTFPINLMNGSGYGLDSSLLTQITNATIIDDPNNGIYPTPFVPLLGTLSGSTFTQAYDPYQPPAATTAVPIPPYVPPAQTVSIGSIAFGWDGADSAYVQEQAALATPNYFVHGYTNKIGALNVARLVFEGGTTAPAPVSVAADLDGNWLTPLVAGFSSGTTYTVTMTEYAATDTAFQNPLAKTSHAQTFTVSLGDLPLSAAGGDALQITGDGNTGGNWIRLQTTNSTVPNGTVLVYTTDAAGNLVGRNGETGAGVTLEDAIRARIGSVTDDRGNVLFGGGQSVYLATDQRLHFAIEGGDNVVEQTPGVNITGTGLLDLAVSGNLGTIFFTAAVDNTLTATETLAIGQQMADRPWVNLIQGQTVNIEIAGSAANVNTVHFVHIDVDAATNAWSVGGVAYGNTDAFRAAVQNNWDSNFAAQHGGGTFHNNMNWTVGGTSGFYSPVLATQRGDIFVIGTANVDGREHIRAYGENIYGFEDLRADQGSDFDYNDMIVKMTVS